jgi:hypothetical protein
LAGFSFKGKFNPFSLFHQSAFQLGLKGSPEHQTEAKEILNEQLKNVLFFKKGEEDEK